MTPNINFYQLDTDKQANINQIICDFCFDFYQQNRTLYILCPNLEYSHELDEFIINYIKDKFFPYSLYGEGPIPPAQICLGIEPTTKLKYDILINLHSIIPDNFIKYREIIELVAQNEQMRSLSRAHYKHYRQHNCDVKFNETQYE